MNEHSPSGVLGGWKVLVIDDDPAVLRMTRDILDYYGATVQMACGGREGIALAQAQRPDFIVSDLSMPELDGWDLLYELRRDPVTAVIPVIAMTAHQYTANHERALLAGFDHFVTKPITPALFIHDLLRILDRLPGDAKR